jgi:hypothetical protein
VAEIRETGVAQMIELSLCLSVYVRKQVAQER